MKKKRVIAWIMAAAMTFAPSATYADLVETPQGETSPSEAVETIANEEAEYELGEPHEEPVYELDAPDAQGTTDDETVYELDEPDVQIAADESTDAASPKASASDMAEVVMDDGSATTYSDAQSLLNAVASYSGKTFTIKLHSNVPTTNAGMFKIPSNSKVTLDLNGFSINRHKANADYDTDDDWEVMIVYENANLTIEDSDPTDRKSVV